MKHRQILSPKLPELALPILMLVAALSGTLVPAQVRQFAHPTSIENFGKVDDNYYRGSQPDQKEYSQLRQMGIRTIIDLRKDHKPEAGEWATQSGLRYYNIPLKASQAATEEQTNYFLSLVNDPANWPVYVHCKGGRHRTGALTAVYRMSHDGWTADQAFKEMKQYDFDNGIFGGPSAQKKFVFSFYNRHHFSESAK